MASDSKQRRALLWGLRDEFDVTTEVIRGMGKSLSESVALLMSKDATLLTTYEANSSCVKSLDTRKN